MARIKEYASENQVDADLWGKIIHRRIDLQFQKGSSDKVYICYAYESQVVTKSGNIVSTYHAMAYYGRRGASLNANRIGTFSSVTDAVKAAEQQARKKESGGSGSSIYTRVNDEYGSINAAASSAQTSSPNKLNLDSITIPKFTFISDLKSYLVDPEFIIERVDEMKFVLLFLLDGEVSVHNRDTGDYIRKFPSGHPKLFLKGYQSNKGTILEAYRTHGSRNYAITDIIQHPNVPDLHEKMWKVRRGTLSHVMSEIYPKTDLYDTSLPMHLNDYWYDDKEIAYDRLKGIVVAKDINDSYSNDWLVTTKA